ncbi:MAG TPA: molybdenum cofactor guanylyltransferase [Pyrinomonadaceae bacterium]|jgi:molybdopterin-guanine dinucleotide biosynthesis protein A|nr:molybdenum cofactor guanylyltransferase [Pyrinomonadaceae bacterium]
MDSIEGFILVGGQSRRMGTDKSRLVFAGQTFVERIAGELSAVTSAVKLVGSNPASAELKLPTVPDVYSQWGALGGVQAALSACSAEWALVVACDFPFVTRQLFARLASMRADGDAVAPIQNDGIPQPLCALYRVEPCLRLSEQFIKSGERKPVALLQSVQTRWVSFDELSYLEAADRFFENINTPEDYVRLNEKGFSTDNVAMGSNED